MSVVIRKGPAKTSIFNRRSSDDPLTKKDLTNFISRMNQETLTSPLPLNLDSPLSTGESPVTNPFIQQEVSQASAVVTQDVNTQADVQFAAKLRVGLKLKIFVMTSALITTSAIILNSVTNGILLSERSKPDQISEVPIPKIDLPTSHLTSPIFKVWERHEPQNDGAPYVDYVLQERFRKVVESYNQHPRQQSETVAMILPSKTAPYQPSETEKMPSSIKHEERRSTPSTTAAPSTTSEPSTTTEKIQLVTSAPEEHFPIPFRSFACNLLSQHWVCSKSGSSFCIFFSSAVPSSSSIVVAPITSVINPKDMMDRELHNFKCKGKMQVKFVRSSHVES